MYLLKFPASEDSPAGLRRRGVPFFLDELRGHVVLIQNLDAGSGCCFVRRITVHGHNLDNVTGTPFPVEAAYGSGDGARVFVDSENKFSVVIYLESNIPVQLHALSVPPAPLPGSQPDRLRATDPLLDYICAGKSDKTFRIRTRRNTLPETSRPRPQMDGNERVNLSYQATKQVPRFSGNGDFSADKRYKNAT